MVLPWNNVKSERNNHKYFFSFLECGGVYYDEFGYILSPYYPSAYNSSTECMWVINAKHGEVIILHVHDFRLQSSLGDCQDSLQVSWYVLFCLSSRGLHYDKNIKDFHWIVESIYCLVVFCWNFCSNSTCENLYPHLPFQNCSEWTNSYITKVKVFCDSERNTSRHVEN